MIKNISFIVMAVAVAIVPSLSYASTFAFVNQLGNVSTVNAETPASALVTAFNIDEHSGVLWLNLASDYGVIGDHVYGI